MTLCVLPGPWAVIQLPPTHKELAMPRSQGSGLFKCRRTNLDNSRSYKLGGIILITGCRPYLSILRIDSEREPLGGE
jgi:hypothetical protein